MAMCQDVCGPGTVPCGSLPLAEGNFAACRSTPPGLSSRELHLVGVGVGLLYRGSTEDVVSVHFVPLETVGLSGWGVLRKMSSPRHPVVIVLRS